MRTYAQNNPVSIAGGITGLIVALVSLGLDAVNWGDSVEAQLVVLGTVLATVVGGIIGRYFQRWTISLAVEIPDDDDIDHPETLDEGRTRTEDPSEDPDEDISLL